jgi:glucokinase
VEFRKDVDAPVKELFASVDLGGTKIACALAGSDGEILCEQRVPTGSHEGPAAVLERVAASVRDLVARAGPAPLALGMGVPGLVDVRQGVTKFLPNLPTQWREVPAARILSARLGCPVFLLNDARMAALGEFTFGRGQAVDTMVFFTLGTGIGGGVIVDGKLRLGPLGAAGELGHQTVQRDGPLCGCGNRGCLEALASGPALVAEGVRLMQTGLAPLLFEIVSGNVAAITPKEMGAAARAGDTAVREAIARAAGWLGIGVANVVNALAPELVVLGGSVAALDELLLEPVRATVRDRVRMFPVEDLQIERSLLGDNAGLLGGIALAASGAGALARAEPPGSAAGGAGAVAANLSNCEFK